MKNGITKEHIRKAIESNSIREKVKILGCNGSHIYLGTKGNMTSKEIKQIYDSVPESKTEEFNHLLKILNAMTSRRDSIYLFHSRLMYNALLTIQTLNWLHEKNCMADIFNEMYNFNKKMNRPLMDGINSLMKSINFLDFSIKKDVFYYNADKYKKNIKFYRKSYLNALIQAKTISITFENFVKEHHAEDLIPFDIKRVLDSFKENHDESGELTKMYYEYCETKSKERELFQTEQLFPSYDSIKPNEAVIRKKIISL